ncbi:MAG: alanine/glycine:cation symporter family protein [Pseudomonadales bacterium]|nr:alanine/glycine:cation symporter family protein [Pseudomonadales bacterium]
MIEFVNTINAVVWSPALVFLCLAAGLYFSIRTRFVQLRHLGEMVRLIFQGKGDDSGISSFQALTMTLAGRVGTGNIAGVATAITFGGPGALFWMWVVAFLGASSAYVESTLGQLYKEKIEGQYRGGPAFYIEKGLGIKWYAWLFAATTILACGVLLPGIQANAISSSMDIALGVPRPVTAGIIAVLLAAIIFGGVRRIAAFAATVVPFMALAYILVALFIIAINIDLVPAMFMLIVNSAFGLDATFGAILGQAIMWGVRRGIYSNEAGQGNAPHASSAAAVSHPSKQGLVQAFSVYVDTLFICSATGFMLLITGLYNVEVVDGERLYTGVAGVAAGPGYVQTALENLMPGFGELFVALALFFFAFTTIIAYYYIAETNITYINRTVQRPWLSQLLRLGLIGAAVYGAVKTAAVAWGLGDIGVGLMAWLNIIAIILLQKPALLCLRDYERQQAEGKNPDFNPEILDIKGADYWVERRLRLERKSVKGSDEA